MTPLERITQRVNRNGDVDEPGTPSPLLTLEEFFSGNDVVGSILCNRVPTPLPSEVFAALRDILDRADVVDVRVQVSMFDDPAWPFSDTVWVITSAAVSEVAGWFPEALCPDDSFEGLPTAGTVEQCDIPDGMRVVRCWWD